LISCLFSIFGPLGLFIFAYGVKIITLFMGLSSVAPIFWPPFFYWNPPFFFIISFAYKYFWRKFVLPAVRTTCAMEQHVAMAVRCAACELPIL
jgi:hypothetical protein